MPFEQLWLPWTGDLPGIVERRVLRVVVPYGGYQFYYDRGEPKGAVYELLETHDILEMVNAGLVALTVADDYKAEFWSEVFPDLELHRDLRIHSGGQTSWAYRKDSPELAAVLERFMQRFGKGTLVGNDTYSRYLADAERVHCAPIGRDSAELTELESALRTSAAEFDFDWLMLAAQAFQESRFHHGRRSPAGAVGVMQIKPSTAADRSVGLAAYNAGPARIARLRNEAAAAGYERNVWFDNVEIVAGRRIGRETTSYVGNIFKYFLGYHLLQARESERKARLDGVLGGCQKDGTTGRKAES